MCWNATATATMVGLGAVATIVSARRGDRTVVPLTLGYFTAMEALQLAGYAVIDQCGSPTNQSVTLLSILHIAFQPFIINAFIQDFCRTRLKPGTLVAVYTVCALSSVTMLMQLYPFSWATPCQPGANLCGSALCTVSGQWHLAWNVPYMGVLTDLGHKLGITWGFPTYMVAAFFLPAAYGAWRFALYHAVVGPWLASLLTNNPNEVPAIWCLFSIGIILMVLVPQVRRIFEWSPWAYVPAERSATPATA